MRAENSRTQQYPQVNEGKIIDPARQMRQGENGNSALFFVGIAHLPKYYTTAFLNCQAFFCIFVNIILNFFSASLPIGFSSPRYAKFHPKNFVKLFLHFIDSPK